MSGTVQPGWYPAPGEPGFERQWDGATWTDQRRAAAPRPSATSNPLAIAAFAIGIVSLLLFLFFILFPPLGVIPLVGVVLGVVAVRRWRQRGGRVFAHLGLWFSGAMSVWAWVISFAQAFS